MSAVWRTSSGPLDDGEWLAIHVGVLKFDFFDEETTGRWVSEDCPEGKNAFRHRETCVHPNYQVPALDFRALTSAISPRFRPLSL
jgi:hypothetical protein